MSEGLQLQPLFRALIHLELSLSVTEPSSVFRFDGTIVQAAYIEFKNLA
jgi:hypothetical protein